MEILNKYVYDPQMDLLGKGGFATVYKAYDKILEMPVALKFFHPQEQSNKYTIINEIKKPSLYLIPTSLNIMAWKPWPAAICMARKKTCRSV